MLWHENQCIFKRQTKPTRCEKRRKLQRKTRGHGLGIQNGRSRFGPARVLPPIWSFWEGRLTSNGQGKFRIERGFVEKRPKKNHSWQYGDTSQGPVCRPAMRNFSRLLIISRFLGSARPVKVWCGRTQICSCLRGQRFRCRFRWRLYMAHPCQRRSVGSPEGTWAGASQRTSAPLGNNTSNTWLNKAMS